MPPACRSRRATTPAGAATASRAAALVGSGTLGAAPPLLETRITISWFEGVDEIRVERTTFSFDAPAVASLLPEDAQNRGGDGRGNDDGGEDFEVE